MIALLFHPRILTEGFRSHINMNLLLLFLCNVSDTFETIHVTYRDADIYIDVTYV
jgi:hypothetical protein